MEKAKPLKRGPNKVKASLFPSGDFIALGTKASRPTSDVQDHKSSTSSTSDRKWDVSSSGPSAAKKAKLSGKGSPITALRVPAKPIKEIKGEQWDTIALDLEAQDILPKIFEMEQRRDDAKIEAYLCGSVKLLIKNRAKPEANIYLPLLYLSKIRPNYFSGKLITEALCSLLKRDVSVNYKTKGNNLVSILAVNLLMKAYSEEFQWPESFVKVFIEDSLGERIWVDQEDCKGFVDNILTAFNTQMPPRSALTLERSLKSEACPSPPTTAMDEDETSSCSMVYEPRENVDNIPVFPRYAHNAEAIEANVIEIIQEQLSRRQAIEVSRNMLKLLMSTCGISDIRLLVSQKLETWQQNPKLTKPAQDLLLAVCLNCNKHNQPDVEVISHLIKIRNKTKPVINHFMMCIKELLGRHPENLSTVLKNAIYNELSASRNPNNMQLLSIIFQHSPDKAEKVLAEVFLDLLLKKDDYLRALRILLREIIRTLRHEFCFVSFNQGLLQERKDAAFKELESTLKERYFTSICDLNVLVIFLGISPAIKDAFNTYGKSDKKEMQLKKNYQNIVATIQKDVVNWFHIVVPKHFKISRDVFTHCLHKVLFMEQAEHYYNKDNWPPESDRAQMLRWAAEVPLMEETVLRITMVGLSRDHPFSQTDCLELLDQLIKRAGLLYKDLDMPVLAMDKIEIINTLFSLCVYHHPDHITLPPGYQAPRLAISDLYWKSWIVLLIIVGHNPSNFGPEVWEKYPTLTCLMEMCITNNFIFPPPTMAIGEKADEIKSSELQIARQEKDQILEFETHLASSCSSKVTITESNSHLLSKLITLDPCGVVRKPPQSCIEQIANLNHSLKLGHMLCSSRSPDFLLDIITRQGTTQAMPWLAELVESSEGALSMLPIQCLCEFLLNGAPPELGLEDENSRLLLEKKKNKQEELLNHLHNLLVAEEDYRPTYEILEYFSRRLGSHQSAARNLAAKGLGLVLSYKEQPVNEDIYQCFLSRIPNLLHFETVKAPTTITLRGACHVESNPQAIFAYVLFLAKYTPDDNHEDFKDLALDMGQMISERPTILNYIVPPNKPPKGQASQFLMALTNLFLRFLNSCRRTNREPYPWAEAQDNVLIQWINKESATLHIVVVQAMIILLTYGPPEGGEEAFRELLETWFPRSGLAPQAYLVDTSEEACILTDWLKLRMIRSTVNVLVDAALKDLDASQLILFIQSFGIPVSSMNKILYALDMAVEYDNSLVEQSVADKSYMAQLVEVQHLRGAKGGHKFAMLLEEKGESDNNKDEEPMAVHMPVIQPVPRPSMPIKKEQILPAIIELFLNEPKNNKRLNEVYTGLRKGLQNALILKFNHSYFIEEYLDSCIKLIQSTRREEFIAALHKKYFFSIALFRLILTDKNVMKNKILFIFDQILTIFPVPKSPVSNFCRESMGIVSNPAIPKWKEELRKVEVSVEYFQRVIEQVDQQEPSRLEETLKSLVHEAVLLECTHYLVVAMTNILIDMSLKSTSRKSLCRQNLFVDWLKTLEPELKQLQKNLIFSRCDISMRPYFLLWLIHQTGWTTLRNSIDFILKKKNSNFDGTTCEATGYDATAVLDFLSSTMFIRSIKQSRDKKLPKHYEEEDVLDLSPSQIESIVDFILEENKLDKRLSFLLRCHKHEIVLKYLIRIVTESGETKTTAHTLLLQMYFMVPRLIKLIPSSLLEPVPCMLESECKFDIMSHAIILSLSTTDESSQCFHRMADLELSCRKMASTHPNLLLRQLPMLATLLRGRTVLDYGTFKSQNHLNFFNYVLSLLELLANILFHSPAISDIIASYFDLFMTYDGATGSPIFSMFNKFLDFLHELLNINPTKTNEILQDNMTALKDLSSLYEDLPKLRNLLNLSSDIVTPQLEQMAHLTKRLGSIFNSEEVEAALDDLDRFSSRKPKILLNFVDDLKRLTQNSIQAIRNYAFKLLLKVLRNNPKLSNECYTSYIQCLDHWDSNVVTTALSNLPEILILSQENAIEILEKAFNVGIYKNLPVSEEICESFAAVNLQFGC